MPPKKRSSHIGDSEHRGRVTVPRDPTAAALPRAATSAPPKRHKPAVETGVSTPAPTNRYTPPRRPTVRLRPGWHKTLGLALVVGGFTIVILNILMGGGSDLVLLPGGHNELYLLLGLTMAASSMWWFGWFDRER